MDAVAAPAGMVRGRGEEGIAASRGIWVGGEGSVDGRLRLRSGGRVVCIGLRVWRLRRRLVIRIVDEGAFGRAREGVLLASVHCLEEREGGFVELCRSQGLVWSGAGQAG